MNISFYDVEEEPSNILCHGEVAIKNDSKLRIPFGMRPQRTLFQSFRARSWHRPVPALTFKDEHSFLPALYWLLTRADRFLFGGKARMDGEL